MILSDKQKQKRLIQLLRLQKEQLDDEPVVDEIMAMLQLNEDATLQTIKKHVEGITPKVMDDILRKLSAIVETKIIKGYKGEDGVNGKDVDEVKIIENVLKRIPTPKNGLNGLNGKNGSPDTPIQIKEKIETLEGEDRIDAKAIKNLPKGTNISAPRILSKLSDVVVTDISDDQVLKWDSTLNKWVNSTSGGGMRYATYVVDASGNGDYTDLQSAITALGTTGGKIFVRAGTYTVGAAGIRFTSASTSTANITIEGEGSATRFNFNTASLSTCFAMGDTTKRSIFRFKNFRISQQGTAGTGTAFDWSYFTESTFENIRIDGCNKGFYASGTIINTGALYNKFYHCTASVAGASSIGFGADDWCNENMFVSCRSQSPSAGVGTEVTTGFMIDAHANKLINCVAESDHLYGIDIQSLGYGTLIDGCYLEANKTNLNIASGVASTTVVGGFIEDATTADIVDNGTDTAFINVSQYGGSYGSQQAFLFSDYVTANNTTTTETDLYSHSIAGNVFTANGSNISASYSGTVVGHATATRQIKVKFGGTTIFDSGALNFASAGNWDIRCDIIRETSTVVRAVVTALSTVTAMPAVTYTRITGLTLSGANTLVITGQAGGAGAASNDISGRMSIIRKGSYA